MFLQSLVLTDFSTSSFKEAAGMMRENLLDTGFHIHGASSGPDGPVKQRGNCKPRPGVSSVWKFNNLKSVFFHGCAQITLLLFSHTEYLPPAHRKECKHDWGDTLCDVTRGRNAAPD